MGNYDSPARCQLNRTEAQQGRNHHWGGGKEIVKGLKTSFVVAVLCRVWKITAGGQKVSGNDSLNLQQVKEKRIDYPRKVWRVVRHEGQGKK